MGKQKKVEESEEEQAERKRRKGRHDDYLPERKTYEELCRGEGIRMVRRQKHFDTLISRRPSESQLVCSVRPPAGRAASTAVTTTTTDTPNT